VDRERVCERRSVGGWRRWDGMTRERMNECKSERMQECKLMRPLNQEQRKKELLDDHTVDRRAALSRLPCLCLQFQEPGTHPKQEALIPLRSLVFSSIDSQRPVPIQSQAKDRTPCSNNRTTKNQFPGRSPLALFCLFHLGVWLYCTNLRKRLATIGRPASVTYGDTVPVPATDDRDEGSPVREHVSQDNCENSGRASSLV